ncbi:MAG: prepilin-type N-terminal cleavage/methylation domain-containing protein [Rhodoferax sp.]|uniref:prepilin-type N-terminal cleavage/methylation domain-containing protein n=1 Tax=Rhodoferax sp. TaxID=50421 RepID=UPI00272F220E|nr:prepilin-type N-terminal cleavage/methylation domain-containing protein [Rhodoferax sp.]MDP1529374.1 prepilin-type N-terminal cleavage/methylation domain-containing protein [Rhodoferax sp.]
MYISVWNKQRGFTLIELLIALVIAGILISIAVPNYREYVERTRRTTAIKDIAEISMALERYRTMADTFPDSLNDLNIPLPLDPWGNAYQYLGIDVASPPNTGALRKDKNLNPLNSDYDLYSMGPDGLTQKQLTAARARDDIVRAGNGGFIGLAAEH